MLGGEIEIAISASEVIRERHQWSVQHGTWNISEHGHCQHSLVKRCCRVEGEEPSKHQQVIFCRTRCRCQDKCNISATSVMFQHKIYCFPHLWNKFIIHVCIRKLYCYLLEADSYLWPACTELATHTDTERLSEEIPWSTFNFHSASIPMVQKWS